MSGHNHVLQYVSSMKSTFYFLTHTARRGVFRYDNATGDWTRVGGIPRHEYGGYGSAGTVCFDTKRNRMVFSGAARAYDLAKDEWIDLADADIWRQFRSVTRSTLTYDAANDVVVAFRYHSRPGWSDPDNYVRIYDPEADAWLEETLEGPPNRGGRVPYAQYNAFYDPELNAHFMYAAGDGFNHRVKMWVCRYKRREQ